MSMTRVMATLVAAVVALSCSAPASPKFALKAAERRGKLESNGLRFVIMPDETTQIAQVDTLQSFMKDFSRRRELVATN